jgi:hypothetical protein
LVAYIIAQVYHFMHSSDAASLPFTITPSSGLYTGGDSATINGTNFTNLDLTGYAYTDKSYVAKEDLVIQLDGIQNRRGVPLTAGTALTGNVASNASAVQPADNGLIWQDLACRAYGSEYAYVAADAADCQDFLPRSTSDANAPTLVATNSGLAMSLNGNAAFQIDHQFNLASYVTTTTNAASSKTTVEVYHKANTATGTANAILYEYGAANTTNPGFRLARYSNNANGGVNANQCYSSQGNNNAGLAFGCVNDTNWYNNTSEYTRYNGGARLEFINGGQVGTVNATAALGPTASNTWFLGARSMTTAATGTYRYNGQIAAFRLYRRGLTAEEKQCNYWVDQARYEGVVNPGLTNGACAAGAAGITGTGVNMYQPQVVTVTDPAWTAESYAARANLVIQLDAIQNKRNSAVVGTAAGVAITGGGNANTEWEDLACNYTNDYNRAITGFQNTTCEDFQFWGTGATWIGDGSKTTALHLTGAQGLRIAAAFNIATPVNGTTNVANAYLTIEDYHRLNVVGTAAAVLYEYNTTYNGNPGFRFVRNAATMTAATPTFASGSCFSNQSATSANHVWNNCTNDTNWANFATTFTRYNGGTRYEYDNGAAFTPNVTNANSNAALTPASAQNIFIGARYKQIDAATGTGSGTAFLNGEMRGWRFYNKALTAQEVQCNYWVDQARYEGVINPALITATCSGLGVAQYTETIITPQVPAPTAPAPTVTIGGNNCPVTAYTATSITCTVPAGSPGKVDVVVTPNIATGLPVQTSTRGYEYLADTFDYIIENYSTSPFQYRIDAASLRIALAYNHVGLITISYPRTASDGTATTINSTVTMANVVGTPTPTIGGQCGGVTCMTLSIPISNTLPNIDGANGLISYLKSLTWSGGNGFLRGEIKISVLPEQVAYYMDADGNRHFYRIDDLSPNGGNYASSWAQAYNYASQQNFHGLTGYLASMTTIEEARLIQTFGVARFTPDPNGTQQNVAWTAGIRALVANPSGNPNNTNSTTNCWNNMAMCSRLDSQAIYSSDPTQNGTGTHKIPDQVASNNAANATGTYMPTTNGWWCSKITEHQWCTTTQAAYTAATCDTQATAEINTGANNYVGDYAWYWATPVDDPHASFWTGRNRTECGQTNAVNSRYGFNSVGGANDIGWTNDQPQNGEPTLAFDAAAHWHDYGNESYANNAEYSVRYAILEFSEGWSERGGGEYEEDSVTFYSAPIPLEITIHHVRANTGETLAADTKAPSMGLNTTTNQFQCGMANGGIEFEGYAWATTSCINGQYPYDPSNQNQEITYTYAHISVPNPVPFRIERTTSGGNYVYVVYPGDAGTAVDGFGPIRQIKITYPSSLTFNSTLPSGWSATNSSGQIIINMTGNLTVSATEVQTYLQTITLTSSGLTDVVGNVVVEVSDYPDVPATGDPGRTSTTAALPQPVRYHYYRLGQTTNLLPPSQTISLINDSFNLAAPPQYLTNCASACTATGATAANADYEFYQSTPAINYQIAYRSTPWDVYYYYQPTNGFTVSFSMNGETPVSSIPSQVVPTGDTVARPPSDPVVLGIRFINWYTSSACSTIFNFATTTITSDLTIYACFEAKNPLTVRFNDDSPAGTPTVHPDPTQLTNITYNSLISAPSAPILPGSAFIGWNTAPMTDASTCAGNTWDFLSDRIQTDTLPLTAVNQVTLYVCWAPRGDVSINFNTAVNAPAVVQVLPNPPTRAASYNGTTTPPVAPVSEGYAFLSWNTEPMLNATTCGGSAFDFSTRLTAPVTVVYSCWGKRANLNITFLKGSENGNPAIQNWPDNVHDMPYNSAAAAYQPDVQLAGWRLSHWCDSDHPDCSRNDRFNWATRRTSDLTLTAVWREDSMAVDEVVPPYGHTDGGYRVSIYGSGFLNYDARSYVQNGLAVLLDGANNAGSLGSATTSGAIHDPSATVWNNLAPASSTAFGNFNLTNATINNNNISFNGVSSRALSATTANFNAAGLYAQTTVETAFRQNAVGTVYTQLWNYGSFNETTGAFGEVLNANAYATTSLGNCYIAQRTGANVFTGGAGACSNNTALTTHSVVMSKVSGVPRLLIVDGVTAPPAVNVANTTTTYAATRSLMIGARTVSATAPTNFANVSINSFRLYNRQLSNDEIHCNYLVDLARFQSIFDPGLAACGSQLVPISPDVIKINGLDCTAPIVISDELLTCTVPASTLPGSVTVAPYREGTVDVMVSVSDKTATLTNGFTYQAPLAVFNIAPSSGSDIGGNTITITGTDFRDLAVTPYGLPIVTIGGKECTNVALAANGRSLTCIVPPTTTGVGPKDVTVLVPIRGESVTIAAGYTYTASMTVTNVAPNVGGTEGGTTLTVTGTGFNSTTLTYSVIIDPTSQSPAECIITDRSATTITCVTTEHLPGGPYDIYVSNGTATIDYVAGFTYYNTATSYINECYDGTDWVNSGFELAQGGSADCRITFDAPYQGTITVADDYPVMVDPRLSGTITSSDTRFNNGVFTLNYNDADATTTTGQVLLYTYTAPTASVLAQFYDGTDTSEGYVGNGYDLYWPALTATNSTGLSSGNEIFFGLYAETYWIYPNGANIVYCVGCEASFILSTHGAPYDGTITLSDDLTHSDNPSGTTGIFGVDGILIDLNGKEGADTSFTYQPLTKATSPNYIRINGASDPPITDAYYDIQVIDSCLSITGPPNMLRGQTAQFTLTVSCGASWQGEVTLSDPFNTTGTVGGTFADTTTSPTSTFNSASKTYTFDGTSASETFVRTFNWTMRDDSVSGLPFPSYIIYITADDSIGAAYTPVFVDPNKLTFTCASNYPNCTTAYVGTIFDVSIAPNGMMIGSANVTSNSDDQLGHGGVANWSASDPYVMSVTPASPGRKILTATVSASNNSSMISQSFASNSADSLNDYIWVMANQTSLSGPTTGMAGQTGNYTMVMNGPFEGTILLSAVLANGITNAGGTFSPSTCVLTRALYDPVTNTTTCNFTYTPATYATDTTVTLKADKQTSYSPTVASSTLALSVHAPMTVTSVCRSGTNCDNTSPVAGGIALEVHGHNFIPTSGGSTPTVILDPYTSPAQCTDVVVVDNNTITCTAPAHTISTVDVLISNGVESAALIAGFTYVPTLTNVSPIEGTTAGGNTLTITGSGFISGQTAVNLDSLPCTSVNVASSTSLTCVAPAHAEGFVNIILSVNSISASPLVYAYEYVYPIHIVGITPSYGLPAGGNTVTIVGDGFVSPTVTIGGQPCTNAVVTGDTIITCQVPATSLGGSGEGAVDVVVTSSGVSATLPSGYIYRAPMTLSLIAPNPVPIAGGTIVTIKGWNIIPPSSYTAGTPTTVQFVKGASALSCTNVSVIDNSTITCITPQAAVGTYDVVVNNGYESAQLTSSLLTYEVNPIILTNIDPNHGYVAGGNTVVITGSGLVNSQITNTAYRQLEYLNFTGTQYINSGVLQTGNTRVTVDFQYNAVATATTSALFGSRSAANANQFDFMKPGTNNFRDDWVASQITLANYPFDTLRHTLVKDNGMTYFDIDQVATRTGANPTTGYNMYIGAINQANVVQTGYFQGRIYSFRIEKEGLLTRDYVPACRVSDNVAGLYDSINNTFTAAAAGTLSCAGIPSIATEVTIGGNICTNLAFINSSQISCVVPASELSGDGSGTVDVTVTMGDQSNTLPGAYTYFAAATGYTNECYNTDTGEWELFPYIAQGSTIECRLILNNPYSGTIEIDDNYSETINPVNSVYLSGTINSADLRFLNGAFVLTYDNTYAPASHALYYTYTAPSSSTLDTYYQTCADLPDPTTCDWARGDNGYELYWPILEINSTTELNNNSDSDVEFGLLANTYYIYPNGTHETYCVGCEVPFILSTHGAPYFGLVTMNDDLSHSDNPSGTHGVFGANGASGTFQIDMSGNDGADGAFSYKSLVAATNANYVYIYGTSANPSIVDSGYIMSPINQSDIIITGTPFLVRGETGEYTLTVGDGTLSGWSGTVSLQDLFNVGGSANGVFADTSTGGNPSGTWNSGSRSYAFTNSPSETYVRTFTYTMRNDAASGDPFPSYIVYLQGDDGNGIGYTPVYVAADNLTTQCGTGTSCATAYVNESRDYSLRPNGMLIGVGAVSDGTDGTFSYSSVTWSTADPFVDIYTPRSPGHKVISTVISSEINTSMDGQVYTSYGSSSLNGFIYVMANQMTITGASDVNGGTTHTYTLTMNGPFVGAIVFSDVLANGYTSAAGTFSSQSCSFTLNNYVYDTNNGQSGTGTTVCTFDYTPVASVASVRTVTLKPAINGVYTHNMTPVPLEITVRSPMTATSLSPTMGASLGNDLITIIGNNLDQATLVQLDGLECTDLTIISSSEITCINPAHAAGTVDIVIYNATDESTSLPGAFTYVGFDPSSGLDLGGEDISFFGNGFSDYAVADLSVTFDGIEVSEIIIIDDSTFVVVAPPHAAGVVDVIATIGDNVLEWPSSYEYVESYLTGTLDTSGTILELYPTSIDNAITSSSQTISIATNIGSGFTLQISAAQTDRNMYSANPANLQTLTPGTGTPTSPALLGANQWGFAIPKNQFDTAGLQSSGFSLNYPLLTSEPTSTQLFAAIPDPATPFTAKITNTPSPLGSEDTTTVVYAALATFARFADSYTCNILYTFVPNN